VPFQDGIVEELRAGIAGQRPKKARAAAGQRAWRSVPEVMKPRFRTLSATTSNSQAGGDIQCLRQQVAAAVAAEWRSGVAVDLMSERQ